MESFVPLTAAAAPSTPREFKVAILNGHTHAHGGGNGHANAGETKSGFQSLEVPRPTALHGATNVEKKIGEPRVTVQRDGDRVTHLRIQCTCGMVIDFACVYDGSASV